MKSARLVLWFLFFLIVFGETGYATTIEAWKGDTTWQWNAENSTCGERFARKVHGRTTYLQGRWLGPGKYIVLSHTKKKVVTGREDTMYAIYYYVNYVNKDKKLLPRLLFSVAYEKKLKANQVLGSGRKGQPVDPLGRLFPGEKTRIQLRKGSEGFIGNPPSSKEDMCILTVNVDPPRHQWNDFESSSQPKP